MPIPERKKQPTGIAGLEWLRTDDGSLTLWNAELEETYHSGCGAIAESLAVYLFNSGVAERLQQGLATSVFEVGFGTGTNFWLTAAHAERCGASLDYEAIDCWLPPGEVFDQLRLTINSERNSEYPAGSDLLGSDLLGSDLLGAETHLLEKAQHWLEAWCQWRKQLSEPVQQETWNTQAAWNRDTVALRLNIMRLEAYARTAPAETLDAVYFDAFSPQTSPELWTETVFSQLHTYLKQGGRLVTYCVKRVVQDRLVQVGFEVRKLPGPTGGKREVLVAIK